jgi:hypothetical protein
VRDTSVQPAPSPTSSSSSSSSNNWSSKRRSEEVATSRGQSGSRLVSRF